MKNPSRLAVDLCKEVGWDAKTVPVDRYVTLLEKIFEELDDTFEDIDAYFQKNLQMIDDTGVKELRKKLAFPEGTVAVLPQENDVVVLFRDLTRFEQEHLLKAYAKKIVGTSKQGLARVNKSGEIDPATVQAGEQLDAIDKLIQLTALAVGKRQQNPEDVQGKTQLGWRLE